MQERQNIYNGGNYELHCPNIRRYLFTSFAVLCNLTHSNYYGSAEEFDMILRELDDLK